MAWFLQHIDPQTPAWILVEAAQKPEVLVALVVMWFKEDITPEPGCTRIMDPVMFLGGMQDEWAWYHLRSFFDSLIRS